MSWPAGNRKDHLAFCRIEGWTQTHAATGKQTGHHYTFELQLADGRILRTRISHPPSRSAGYGAGIWKHILKDQLDVTEEVFWNCVRHKVLPRRAEPAESRVGIPVDLFRLLTGPAGLPEREVLAMTKEQAIAAAAEYWSAG